MPVITCGWYNVDHLRRNPEWLFLFGDNYKRTGKGGQAAICRDEPNTCGIRTKWEPTNRHQAFFSDNDYKRCTAMIAEDLQPAIDRVKAGGTCVLPFLGIGTGRASLEERAPGVARYLQHALAVLVEAGAGQPSPDPIVINTRTAHTMQDMARTSHCYMTWTIWPPAPDHPKHFTAEPSTSACMTPMLERIVDPELDDLRFRLPRGLTRLAPLAVESGNFVETWAG